METIITLLSTDKLLWNYVFLNNGLTIRFNGEKFFAKNGLSDLLERNINGNGPTLYPIVHIKEGDLEFAFTHSTKQYGEEYYSFVNGQHTTQEERTRLPSGRRLKNDP
ncbi:MAG: hypothetical protein R2764_06515 [Bacteroidales bacterium]